MSIRCQTVCKSIDLGTPRMRKKSWTTDYLGGVGGRIEQLICWKIWNKNGFYSVSTLKTRSKRIKGSKELCFCPNLLQIGGIDVEATCIHACCLLLSPGQRGQDCDKCRISLTALQYTEWQLIDFLSPLSTDSCPPHPHCWIASLKKKS